MILEPVKITIYITSLTNAFSLAFNIKKTERKRQMLFEFMTDSVSEGILFSLTLFLRLENNSMTLLLN